MHWRLYVWASASADMLLTPNPEYSVSSIRRVKRCGKILLVLIQVKKQQTTKHVQISHDDVIKWKHFPRYWPFVRGIHRSPVNSRYKGHWRGTLMFSLICARINCWINNREAGDLRRHHAHYDAIVILWHPYLMVTDHQQTALMTKICFLRSLNYFEKYSRSGK